MLSVFIVMTSCSPFAVPSWPAAGLRATLWESLILLIWFGPNVARRFITCLKRCWKSDFDVSQTFRFGWKVNEVAFLGCGKISVCIQSLWAIFYSDGSWMMWKAKLCFSGRGCLECCPAEPHLMDGGWRSNHMLNNCIQFGAKRLLVSLNQTQLWTKTRL